MNDINLLLPAGQHALVLFFSLSKLKPDFKFLGSIEFLRAPLGTLAKTQGKLVKSGKSLGN